MGAILAAIMGGSGPVPPGAFGGTEDLTQEQIEDFCAIRRSRVFREDTAIPAYVLASLSEMLGIPVNLLEEAFADPFLCADVDAAFKPKKEEVVKIPPKVIAINSRGVPVSSNPVFNACVDAYLHGTPAEMKAIIDYNPIVDEKTGRAKSCDFFNVTNSNGSMLWIWPDSPNENVYINISKMNGKTTYTVPKGYAVKKISTTYVQN